MPRGALQPSYLSPEGASLHPKGLYQVGKEIGKGAQGSVHEVLERNNHGTDYVVKAVRLPAPTDKGRKRKAIQLNADTLFKETSLYRSSLLAQLQGKMIPSVPVMKLQTYQETNDFRFFVMEAMEYPLQDIVPELCGQEPVDLASLASRLFDVADAFHQRNHLIIDVKLDNFMLAKPSKKMKTLKDRLRMVDLALAQPFQTSTGGRPVQSTVTDFAGTPLYASLNAHNMVSPSWGDDYFGLLVIIAELAIRVQARLEGTDDDFESTEIPGYLPWSQEQSDADIGEVKKEQVLSITSDFYNRIPASIRNPIFQAFHTVTNLAWGGSPDSTAVRENLAPLIFSTQTPTNRNKRSKTNPVSETVESKNNPVSKTVKSMPTNNKAKDRLQQKAKAKVFMAKRSPQKPSPKPATPTKLTAEEQRRRARAYMLKDQKPTASTRSRVKKPTGSSRTSSTRASRSEQIFDSDNDVVMQDAVSSEKDFNDEDSFYSVEEIGHPDENMRPNTPDFEFGLVHQNGDLAIAFTKKDNSTVVGSRKSRVGSYLVIPDIPAKTARITLVAVPGGKPKLQISALTEDCCILVNKKPVALGKTVFAKAKDSVQLGEARFQFVAPS